MTKLIKIYHQRRPKDELLDNGYVKDSSIDSYGIAEEWSYRYSDGYTDYSSGPITHGFYVNGKFRGVEYYQLSPLFDTAQDAEGFLRDEILAPLGHEVIDVTQDKPVEDVPIEELIKETRRPLGTKPSPFIPKAK